MTSPQELYHFFPCYRRVELHRKQSCAFFELRHDYTLRIYSGKEQATHKGATHTEKLIQQFIESRLDGLSATTIKHHNDYLKRAIHVVGDVSCHDIIVYLKSLKCSNGGKHSYFNVLRTFYNWSYSRKSGYHLHFQDNPILDVNAPKVNRKILPSLTQEQVNYLIDQALCVRDKAIILLFAYSGLN